MESHLSDRMRFQGRGAAGGWPEAKSPRGSQDLRTTLPRVPTDSQASWLDHGVLRHVSEFLDLFCGVMTGINPVNSASRAALVCALNSFCRLQDVSVMTAPLFALH